MPYTNLREFLITLDQLGELVRVPETLSPHLEIPALARYHTEQCREATVFEAVDGYPGFRMVSGLESYSVDPRARMKRVAMALGMPPDTHPLELTRRLAEARNRPPLAPVEVASGPVHDNVLLHEDASLDNLPVPYIHVGDGGPYVNTIGFVVAQTPDRRWTNWSIARVMKHDATTMTGIVWDGQHIGMVADEWKQQGSDMPFALVLGASPAITFAAGVALSKYGHDETSFVGAWFDRPVELVGCKTVDLLVPADAEIVIEGHLLPTHLIPEGPMGEYHGYISPEVSSWPTYRVTAITYRDDPLFPFTNAGKPVDEDHTITGTGIAASALEYFRSREYPVVNAWMPPETATHLLALTLSDEFVKKSSREAIHNFQIEIAKELKAVRHEYYWISRFLFTNEDVDISDPRDLLWAWVTRCRPGDGATRLDDQYIMALSPIIHTDAERSTGLGPVEVIDAVVEITENGHRPASFAENYPDEIKDKVLAVLADLPVAR